MKATDPTPAPGRRHPSPDRLIEFLERYPEHGSIYVLATLDMIRRDFPGSLDELRPRLRVVYKAKRQAERKAEWKK